MSFAGSDAQSAVPDSTSTAPTTNGLSTKDTIVNSESLLGPGLDHPLLTLSGASSAVNAVQNHPVSQSLANGPAAQSVKNQTQATSNEFSGLANSRAPPSYTAANGDQLTHYHSFFGTLLTWEHPRATAITFVGTVAFIFACRYLPILKYFFKMTYVTLGVVSLAEVVGKLVMGTGVATSMRPRRYYKISKDSMEASLDDLEQLINFFVIEVQRIVFAEHVPSTIAAFVAAFLSYYLIKILPFWGLSLLSTCVIFLGPLIYISNKELIDGHLEHANNVVSAQAAQVKDLTAQHTGKAFESAKAYTSDYTAKAGEFVGQSRQKIPTLDQAKAKVTGNNTAISDVKHEAFPSAPKSDPVSDLPNATSAAADNTTIPSAHATTESQSIAASY